ncbi:Uncharacterized protein HZ326_23625 [Fusarium oxysporum f. sp. albedinis]|nr:Uncharacterized protein HZ326_23625 [Fusarium oxysporum f. sp. albedinis]
MDETHDPDSTSADESHFGTQISYILAGLAAVCIVKRKRQHIQAQENIESRHVAPGGIVTLQTLDSTSPAESYKFPPSSKTQPFLELHTIDSSELCVSMSIIRNASTVGSEGGISLVRYANQFMWHGQSALHHVNRWVIQTFHLVRGPSIWWLEAHLNHPSREDASQRRFHEG